MSRQKQSPSSTAGARLCVVKRTFTITRLWLRVCASQWRFKPASSTLPSYVAPCSPHIPHDPLLERICGYVWRDIWSGLKTVEWIELYDNLLSIGWSHFFYFFIYLHVILASAWPGNAVSRPVHPPSIHPPIHRELNERPVCFGSERSNVGTHVCSLPVCTCVSVWIIRPPPPVCALCWQHFNMTTLRQRKGSKGKEPSPAAELQSQQHNCCSEHHPEKILHGEWDTPHSHLRLEPHIDVSHQQAASASSTTHFSRFEPITGEVLGAVLVPAFWQQYQAFYLCQSSWGLVSGFDLQSAVILFPHEASPISTCSVWFSNLLTLKLILKAPKQNWLCSSAGTASVQSRHFKNFFLWWKWVEVFPDWALVLHWVESHIGLWLAKNQAPAAGFLSQSQLELQG